MHSLFCPISSCSYWELISLHITPARFLRYFCYIFDAAVTIAYLQAIDSSNINMCWKQTCTTKLVLPNIHISAKNSCHYKSHQQDAWNSCYDVSEASVSTAYLVQPCHTSTQYTLEPTHRSLLCPIITCVPTHVTTRHTNKNQQEESSRLLVLLPTALTSSLPSSIIT